ncbi:MAG: glycosyltransferase [Blastocatellia bacterium]|nr:glycosyltransferase [Blastocatellia bacterium]
MAPREIARAHQYNCMSSIESPVSISVIIPVHNRREDFRRCLYAIAAQDFPRDGFEVIVCDDGSEEDIKPIVEEAERSGLALKYLRQEQKGPAAARNLCIRHARGPIVAMTDSDALPQRSWLRKLAEGFAANPAAPAVEGKVYADNEGEFDPLGEGPVNKTGGVYLTCNCAYRRDVLLEVGGFDESFPYAAYEDTELAARVRQLGPIVWLPDAIVIHPQRKLTLRSLLKKLRHWEYVLTMGYRYGYLAWERYPVRHPRLRVAALAVIALPLSKLKKACSWLARRPSAAIKLACFGLIESLAALVIVAPRVLFTAIYGFSRRYERKNLMKRDYGTDGNNETNGK